MNIEYRNNCENIDWSRVASLLNEVGMSSTTPEIHKISFDKSYSVLFVFHEDKMIGMGRVISDGVRQSAIYDIAVDPVYQGYGIGKEIISRLMAETPDCNFILYASPGKEDFYRRLGFRKMKTGMAFFADPDRMTDGVFVENE